MNKSLVLTFIVGMFTGWFGHQYLGQSTPLQYNSEIQDSEIQASDLENVTSTLPAPDQKNLSTTLTTDVRDKRSYSQNSDIIPKTVSAENTDRHNFIIQLQPLLDQGLFDEAQNQLEQWLLISPEDFEMALTYGKVLAAKKDFISALIHLYDQTVYVSGGNAAKLYDLINDIVDQAEAYLERHQGAQGVFELFEQLVVLHPDHMPYHLKLAHWALKIGNVYAAEQALASTVNDARWKKERSALESRIKRLKQREDGQQIYIPLERLGQHYLVNAMINDQIPVKLLIDTGASNTVIKSHIIESFDLKNQTAQEVVLNTANGEVTAYQLTLDKFGFLDQNEQHNTAVVAPVDVGVLSLDGLNADGLLGMNVLKHYQFYIDQQDARLVLAP